MSPRRPLPYEQRLVYVQVVEGLLTHGLQGRVSLRLKERLRRAGIDLDRPLMPAYSVPLWMYCLSIIVEETHPDVPPEEGYRRLAIAHVEGYGHTLIGRALYGVMRLLGPHRFVQRIPQLLRGTDNYTEADLTEREPTRYELRLNSNLPMPGYTEALLESMLRLGGATSPRVTKLHADADSTLFELCWQER
ncbi:TIGR02265 family protein [Corallococcus sp. H22C18031201]|nr:TIGR02265 family protein [Corallococcus sp. H22C18031201]